MPVIRLKSGGKIIIQIAHPEGPAGSDLDFDDDHDMATWELDFDCRTQQVHHVYVYENTGNRRSPSWIRNDISNESYASHKLHVMDINEDGRMGIIIEKCRYKIISCYENHSSRKRRKTLRDLHHKFFNTIAPGY